MPEGTLADASCTAWNKKNEKSRFQIIINNTQTINETRLSHCAEVGRAREKVIDCTMCFLQRVNVLINNLNRRKLNLKMQKGTAQRQMAHVFMVTLLCIATITYARVHSGPLLTLIRPQIEVLQRCNELLGMQFTL